MLSVFDQGPPPPCPAPFNLAQYVLAHGSTTPDKIALAILTLSGAERWSYDRLTQTVLGAATGFLEHGAKPGDRILIRVGNTLAFPLTYLAALAVDMIPVPTSAMLTTPEITKIADHINPALIVAEEGIALPNPMPCPIIDAADIAKMASLPPARFVMGDPDRPGYIIFTSGTSGTPHPVTHAHRAIWARRMMWDGWYGLTPNDRMLHAGAFNWTYTLGTGLLDPWTIGATALIPGAGVTPAQLPLLLKRHDATIFAAAPGVYRQMLKAEMPVMPKLRHGLAAGEKLPATLRTHWEDATGTAVHEAYGLTECSTFISGAPNQAAPRDAIGRPQIGRRVAVLQDGVPVEKGEPGTLAVSTSDPGLMLGHWKTERGGPDPVQGDWFETGDTVSMAEDGATTFLGRADDMMNAGGLRVSPIEVETAMNTHPDITECAAVEVAVKADVSVIGLFYVANDDLESEHLAAFASQNLARYKCPRIYTRIETLPKGANGKIQRRVLRDS